MPPSANWRMGAKPVGVTEHEPCPFRVAVPSESDGRPVVHGDIDARQRLGHLPPDGTADRFPGTAHDIGAKVMSGSSAVAMDIT